MRAEIFLPGGVDLGEPGVGELHASRAAGRGRSSCRGGRRARARASGARTVGEVGVARHAEHLPGVLRAAVEVARLDRGEGGLGRRRRSRRRRAGSPPRPRGSGRRRARCGRGPRGCPRAPAARPRNMRGDAPGVGVEAGDVLAGEVEDPRRRRLVLAARSGKPGGRPRPRRAAPARRPWPSWRRGR